MKKRTNHTYIVSGPNGESQGPFEFKEMVRFIAEGKITGATVVQRSDSPDWTTVAGFPELGVKDEVVSRYDEETDALTQEMEQAHFRRKLRPGAVWFFWIAVLSVPNTLAAYVESQAGFALGLSAVYPIGEAAAEFGNLGRKLALGFNLLLCLIYFCFGVTGWKGQFVPFMLGSALYLGDTALAIVADDWISTGIHVLGLATLFGGVTAHLEKRECAWLSGTVAPFAACAILFAGGAWAARAALMPPEQTLAPVSWVKRPHSEWPNLVLTHEAEFRDRTRLQGATAFLATLPNGKVVAVTAKHLLGYAGGVKPSLPVDELNQALVRWELYPRSQPTNTIAVKGLFGPSYSYAGTFRDSLLLELHNGSRRPPAEPLQIRFAPVAPGDKLFIVGVRYENEKQQQEVYVATVTDPADELIVATLEKPADFSGFSGAPMLDANGHVVGVVTAGWGMPAKDGAYSGVSAHSVRELTRPLRAAKALVPARTETVAASLAL